MKRLYCLIILCCLVSAGALAQGKTQPKRKSKGFNKKADENTNFLQKQWWLGFKAGTNLSKAVPIKHYSVISPVNYDDKFTYKKYENFKQLGSQAAVEITFSYRSFSASIQPTYRKSRFVYTNQYEWIENDPNNPMEPITKEYEHEQRMDHVVLPVVVKYEIAGNKLKPYLQVGGYGAFLVNANKTVNVKTTGNFTESTAGDMIGAKDLFAKNHWGFIGGAGLNYHTGNVRFNLDVMYLYGMSNIVSTKNRFTNDRQPGVSDALDDLRLNNLAISLGCLFPLRFLGSGFKSIDK
jgi:Outer membrane protein beta-barrel domain